jgi:hypothetical protein
MDSRAMIIEFYVPILLSKHSDCTEMVRCHLDDRELIARRRLRQLPIPLKVWAIHNIGIASRLQIGTDFLQRRKMLPMSPCTTTTQQLPTNTWELVLNLILHLENPLGSASPSVEPK